jgi:formamidopyrimidine-DNA glycosylase
MPELPEVETVRRTLAQAVVGCIITSVKVRRRSVIDGPATPAALLVGRRIVAVDRHGKELLIRSEIRGQSSTKKTGAGAKAGTAGQSGAGDPCLIVHLGMTGSLYFEPGAAADVTTIKRSVPKKHVHVLWTMDNGGQIAFYDPRRFGGIWPFSSPDEVQVLRWQRLGPDAQKITAGQLHQRLSQTDRAIKAALLDQTVLAGLGNIYVDELLFACRIHPGTMASSLGKPQVEMMIRQVRSLLRRAIRACGSTVRNYRDANGHSGKFQLQHQVYDRGGDSCRVCGRELGILKIGGRTTVFCRNCQRA